MKTVFFKFFLLLGVPILLCLSISSLTAQSLKGKVWQSQDTTSMGIKPETIIFEDSTYTILEFFYSKTGTLLSTGHPQEGLFEQKLGSLTFVKCINGRPTRAYPCKFAWISNTEFSLTAGIQKSTYALLSSSEDHFTPMRIIPYLKTAIARNEKTHPCFNKLANEIRTPLKEEVLLEEKLNAVEDAEGYSTEQPSTKKVTNYSIKGKVWQEQELSTTDKVLCIYVFTDDNKFQEVLTEFWGDIGSGNLKYDKDVPISDDAVGQKYIEWKDSISITEHKLFSNKLKTTVYEIVWLNEFEFKLTSKEFFNSPKRYALFRSPKDRVTPMFPGMYLIEDYRPFGFDLYNVSYIK